MEYSTFVTVSDFLANGGKLTQDRELYRFDAVQYHQIGWYDESKQISGLEGAIIVSKIDRTFQGNDEIIFVKIPCTPQYI